MEKIEYRLNIKRVRNSADTVEEELPGVHL